MPSSAGQTCARSEEHTSELQSHDNLVCRLLLEKITIRSEEHTSEIQSHDNLVCRLLLEKTTPHRPSTRRSAATLVAEPRGGARPRPRRAGAPRRTASGGQERGKAWGPARVFCKECGPPGGRPLPPPRRRPD